MVALKIDMTYEPQYFNNMNEFYYYLGLLAADGYLTRYGVGIDLNDHYLVNSIANYFGCHEPKVYGYKARALINDKSINEIMRTYLRTPHKDTMVMPPIMEGFFSHFLRGYFDGDGSATIENNGRGYIRTRVSIRGPYNFLCELRTNLPIGTVHNHNPRCGQWVIGTPNVPAFTEYIYKDSSIHLVKKCARLVSATNLVIGSSKNFI